MAAEVRREGATRLRVPRGFVPGMNVDGVVFVNDRLEALLRAELEQSKGANRGGFIPSLAQVANVATLPGIVGASIAMPDIHSGYGFAIGNVAAFDMGAPNAVVSPGGVGFDINCGVRLLRTSLTEADIVDKKEALAQSLFEHIPVGVGTKGRINTSNKDIYDVLQYGMDWALREGYAWTEDVDHCEENGRLRRADASLISAKAKARGRSQLGTLGAGNHYAEVQAVEEVYDRCAARAMGLERAGTVCLMIHSGSRGIGHQVASEAVSAMETAMRASNTRVVDRQLAYGAIASPHGQAYLRAMNAAANYAYVNRSVMSFLARQAFSRVFRAAPDELDMHVVYDVAHNIAKEERHYVDGVERSLLVHRKGATRAFGPHHPLVPAAYQSVGQPVLVGGTMGTASYVLVGTEEGMRSSFGSTCHGAGRALSRTKCRNTLDNDAVAAKLRERNIAFRVASPQLLTEEAPESYKDVHEVVNTCQSAGLSRRVVRLRPLAVIKG